MKHRWTIVLLVLLLAMEAGCSTNREKELESQLASLQAQFGQSETSISDSTEHSEARYEDGPKELSEDEIKAMLPRETTEVVIDGEKQSFSVDSLTIEKRQIEEKEDKPYCVVQLSNDYYSFTKYISMSIVFYDKGGWIVDECSEYKDPFFSVKSNPLSDAEVIATAENDLYGSLENGYGLIKDLTADESHLNEGIVSFSATGYERHRFKIYRDEIKIVYTFSGSSWTPSYETTNREYEWTLSNTMGGPLRFVLYQNKKDADNKVYLNDEEYGLYPNASKHGILYVSIYQTYPIDRTVDIEEYFYLRNFTHWDEFYLSSVTGAITKSVKRVHYREEDDKLIIRDPYEDGTYGTYSYLAFSDDYVTAKDGSDSFTYYVNKDTGYIPKFYKIPDSFSESTWQETNNRTVFYWGNSEMNFDIYITQQPNSVSSESLNLSASNNITYYSETQKEWEVSYGESTVSNRYFYRKDYIDPLNNYRCIIECLYPKEKSEECEPILFDFLNSIIIGSPDSTNIGLPVGNYGDYETNPYWKNKKIQQ